MIWMLTTLLIIYVYNWQSKSIQENHEIETNF